MNQSERMDNYIHQAIELLGIVEPEASPESTYDEIQAWMGHVFLMQRLIDLVNEHGELEGHEDLMGRSLAEQRDDLKGLAMQMDALRDALEHFPNGSKLHLFGLESIFLSRGKTRMDLAFLNRGSVPVLPQLQIKLKAMSDFLHKHAALVKVRKGGKKHSPDYVLIAECLKLAKLFGWTKESALRLARLAFWASMGHNPEGDDWGVFQKKNMRV